MNEAEVLIIEDSPTIRELLEETLKLEGYSVMCAEHGAQGLVALQNHPKIKVIILDLEMPVMDGHGFIIELRKQKLSPPLLVITSAAPYQHYPEYINLPKPYDIDRLLKLIAGVIRPQSESVILPTALG